MLTLNIHLIMTFIEMIELYKRYINMQHQQLAVKINKFESKKAIKVIRGLCRFKGSLQKKNNKR